MLKRGLTEADIPQIKGMLSETDTDWEQEVDLKSSRFVTFKGLIESTLNLLATIYRMDQEYEVLGSREDQIKEWE